MPTARQNKFDGGHAEDIRTFTTDECEKSLNFDIFTNPHKLTPYADSIAETLSSGNMSDVQVSDIDVSLIGANYVITGTGRESAISAIPTFYTKSDLVSVLTQQAVSAGNTYLKNSLVIYKDKAYALGYNGSNQYTLYRFNSAGSVTIIGTISQVSGDPSYGTAILAKPFMHPEDKLLYIVIGTSISVWDGSSLSTGSGYNLILPSGFEATSVTEYGTYLAITMRPLRGAGNSVTYLWGRDATLTTLQGIIPWGEGNVSTVENLYNTLVAVVQPWYTFNTAFTNKIIVRGYVGGTVDTLRSITVGSTDQINSFKAKSGDKLYFGSLNVDDCIYAFGKNKEGRWAITKDRYLDNGNTTTAGLSGLSIIGDIMWRGVNSTYKLMRSRINALGESATYLATSVYKTTINPAMPIADRGENKQLMAFRVYYTGKSSGTIGVKYGANTSTMTSIISETTSVEEGMKQATMQFDEKAFDVAKEYQFQLESTGGVDIKAYEYDYEFANQ